MIEIARKIPNPENIEQWLLAHVKAHLRPDVSNYAKDRLRKWLRIEPPLSPSRPYLPGLPVQDAVWDRLKELIEWDFDYCLVTYSGDEKAIGIDPHRDAGYADYEAYGLHICGECRFDYWMGRPTFGYGPSSQEHDPRKDDPTHSLVLVPGDLVRFNCKNLHSAAPGVKRWNLNFWKKKPVK